MNRYIVRANCYIDGDKIKRVKLSMFAENEEELKEHLESHGYWDGRIDRNLSVIKE